MQTLTSHKFVATHVNTYAEKLKFWREDQNDVETENLEVEFLDNSTNLVRLAKWFRSRLADLDLEDSNLGELVANELVTEVIRQGTFSIVEATFGCRSAEEEGELQHDHGA
jgi:hypothetical protein